MEKEFVIRNKIGLHAKPATHLVRTANSYDCDITITYENKEIDLKSIIGVLSLGVKSGALVVVKTSGDDEEEAMKDLSKVFASLNLL